MRCLGPQEVGNIARRVSRDVFHRERAQLWSVPNEVIDEESHLKFHHLDLGRMDVGQLFGALYESGRALAGLAPHDVKRGWWSLRRARVQAELRRRGNA